jgi:hypothetical protein
MLLGNLINITSLAARTPIGCQKTDRSGAGV